MQQSDWSIRGFYYFNCLVNLLLNMHKKSVETKLVVRQGIASTSDSTLSN